MQETKLYERIISHKNIYSAIYCLESYIDEKGLLDKKDLKLYFDLGDKYNFDLIEKIIKKCEVRLNTILDEDNLFEITVFFKMKGIKDEKVNFRPIHTASLIDQICMICLLNVIMYEEIDTDTNNDTDKATEKKDQSSSKIVLSDISKLLPSNFYGNIPSSSMEYLFEPWQSQYRSYSDDIINGYTEYVSTSEYTHEVCLDLVDFFPSIHPLYLLDYVSKKICFESESENKLLRTVLYKLLFFKIKDENLDGWESEYYTEKYENLSISRGLPQGLPHTYFLANLFMINVSKIIDKYFPGKSYYYVDDSVIYTSVELEDNIFENNIKSINKDLKKEVDAKVENFKKSELYNEIKCKDELDFLEFKVELHKSGKSYFSRIGSKEVSILPFMPRVVSLTSKSFSTLDDFESENQLGRINAVLDVLEQEIKKLTELGEENTGIAYTLKLLKRYKRFFMFRQRLIKSQQDGFFADKIDNSFNTLLKKSESDEDIKKIILDEDIKKIILDEEFFTTESRLLISISLNDSHDLRKLNNAECIITGITDSRKKYLYHQQDLAGSSNVKQHNTDAYASLRLKYQKAFVRNLFVDKQEIFIKEILGIKGDFDSNKAEKSQNNFSKLLSYIHDYPNWVYLVKNNSQEFNRRIANAIISTLFGIEISNDFNYHKNNNKVLSYTEIRILTYVRNRRFDYLNFKDFVRDVYIDKSKNNHTENLNYNILEILSLLVKYVGKPKYVDHLIQTHRLVAGLWQNGSKFLNAYTLHNEEHAIDLIKNSIRITKVFNSITLKGDDYYILFLACYLHDISMVIHPIHSKFLTDNSETNRLSSDFLNWEVDKTDVKKKMLKAFDLVFNYFETTVRNNHANDSARLIRNYSKSFLSFINHSSLETVAKVAESHCSDVEIVYGEKSLAESELFSMKYMKIIIRLADLLDMSKNRISYYILNSNIEQMSPDSQFHWISHLATESCNFEIQYETEANEEVTFRKPISEKVILTINLWASNLTTLDCDKESCKDLTMKVNLDGCDLIYDILPISETQEKCCEGKCRFLCKWMTKKHSYLFKELAHLKKYLDDTDRSLFNTDIQVKFKYLKQDKLKSEFYDYISSYITK